LSGMIMRIYGPNGTGVVANASQARRTSGGTFSLDQADASRPSASTLPMRSIGGIDALMALQGVEDATERRRRAVKRGRTALDALDELKLGFLAGALDTSALARLKTAIADLADGSGDKGLDGVLAEIGLRVEVELAKFGPPQPGTNRAK
jgi:Class II flagellar assembly regulator